MSREHGPNAARRHIKRQLAARDGQACFYCAARSPDLTAATLDHLIPYSVWPTWIQANLVLACWLCNQAKGDQLPQVFLRPTGYRPGLVPSLSVRARVRAAVRSAVRSAVRMVSALTTGRTGTAVTLLPGVTGPGQRTDTGRTADTDTSAAHPPGSGTLGLAA